MSVKIFNGYSMDVSLVDAFLQIRKMRESFCRSDEFLSCASNAEIKKLLPVIAELLCSKDIEKDENVWFQNAVRAVVPLESELGKSLPERLGLNDFRRTPIVWALRLSEALCAKNEKTRLTFEYDREVSLDMKLVVFPHPRDADKTLLLFYGGEASVEQNSDKTIRDVFAEMSGMKEYNFWNCTDGPDDIPENEWKERGDIWDEAIPSFVPNKDGLTYTIFSADRDRLIPMSIEYVEKRYAEYREKSIQRIANNNLTKKFYENADNESGYHISAYEAICLASEEQYKRTDAYLEEERRVAELIPEDYATALERLGAKETVILPCKKE